MNRDSPSARSRLKAIRDYGGYYVHPYGAEPSFVEIAAACTYEEADLQALASHSDNLLLTTALKREGLFTSVDVIRRILELRGARSTVVVAGENQVDTLFLRDLLVQGGFTPHEGTVFVRGVVDRICNKPSVEKGRLEVSCEEFGRIYVEQVNDFFVRSLAKRGRWEVVRDFEFVVDRKKWIVNASHLLMAMVAHYFRFPSVKSFVSEEFGTKLLDKAVTEFTSLMTGHYEQLNRRINSSGLSEFASGLKKRMATFPQRYPDVVTRFSGPDKLAAFFEDFHRKITYLALEKTQREAPAPYFSSLVTHIVVDLIKNERWIRDARLAS